MGNDKSILVLRLVVEKTAASWSGGKDSCLALWRTLRAGAKVDYLLNTVRKDSGRVAFHGVLASLVQAQADAIGIPLVQKTVGDDDYREVFLAGLDQLRSAGVSRMVFGDMDIQQNRQWCEDVCASAGLTAHFPLWAGDQRKLLSEFIQAGFGAVVVCVDSRYFDERDLGRVVDEGWLQDLDRGRDGKKRSTYCGENGEYHTFVYDGPTFKRSIRFSLGEHVSRTGHWLVDLEPLGH